MQDNISNLKKNNLNKKEEKQSVVITENCDGCGYCVNAFECPAIVFHKDKNRAKIDSTVCINCGQCTSVCSKGHIVSVLFESKDK